MVRSPLRIASAVSTTTGDGFDVGVEFVMVKVAALKGRTHDACFREQLERTLALLGEQREQDVDPVDLKEHRQLAHDRLAQADAGAGFADHAETEQALANGLPDATLGNHRIEAEQQASADDHHDRQEDQEAFQRPRDKPGERLYLLDFCKSAFDAASSLSGATLSGSTRTMR